MYALNLSQDRMILSATRPEFAVPEMPVVESIPAGDITEYRYNEDGSFTRIPQPPAPPPAPTMEQRLADLEAENRELKAMVQAMAKAGI